MVNSSLRRNKSHSSTHNLLEGSGGYGAARMRNWPLFLFLSGLVFFFYVFYVYQAVSTELSMKKEQLELQYRQQRILKEEIIDVKADLEKVRSSESGLKTEKESTRSKYEECQSSLRSIKLRSDTLNDEKSAADSAARLQKEELQRAKDRVTEVERAHASLQTLYDAQQTSVQQLNATITLLQTELTSHKTAVAGNEAAAAAAAVAAAPAAGDAVTTTQSASRASGRRPADLGELIKQEGAAAEKTAVESARAEPLKEEERAAVENGEKPDPSGKKPEDELKGAAVMRDDVEGAKEDKEEIKGGDAGGPPGRPGDRVKMEEELMVAEQNQGDQAKLVEPENKEGGAAAAEAAAAAPAAEAAAGGGAGAAPIQGGDYVDKEDADLEGEVKEDGAAAVDDDGEEKQ